MPNVRCKRCGLFMTKLGVMHKMIPTYRRLRKPYTIRRLSKWNRGGVKFNISKELYTLYACRRCFCSEFVL